MDAELPLAGLRCAQCGYCLHGLALRGRCPECGTGYFADLYGPNPPNYNVLLLPAIALALSWVLCVGSARSALPEIRWPLFLILALMLIWAKRTAARLANSSYLNRLVATSINQPPPSRTWYVGSRAILYFLTQIALAKAGLFLATELLRPQYS